MQLRSGRIYGTLPARPLKKIVKKMTRASNRPRLIRYDHLKYYQPDVDSNMVNDDEAIVDDDDIPIRCRSARSCNTTPKLNPKNPFPEFLVVRWMNPGNHTAIATGYRWFVQECRHHGSVSLRDVLAFTEQLKLLPRYIRLPEDYFISLGLPLDPRGYWRFFQYNASMSDCRLYMTGDSWKTLEKYNL